MIRIVIVSDLHGNYINIPDCDIFIDAGDTGCYELKEIWKYNAWLGRIRCKHRFLVPGNHDFPLADNFHEAKELLGNTTILLDSSAKVDGITIYGTPWVPEFGPFAFMLPPNRLAAKFASIPAGLDMLISHGPPFGYGDQTRGGYKAGSKELLDKVIEAKPKIHVFGHIHEAAGTYQSEHTKFINASISNVGLYPTNKPIELSLE